MAEDSEHVRLIARQRQHDAVEGRLDGWVTKVKVGAPGGPKRVSSFVEPPQLDDHTLESLYVNSDFAARIVGEIPEEAMRQGVILSGDPDGELALAADKLGLVEKVAEAWTWGRLYGGGAIYLGFAGHDQSMRLREEDIRPGSLRTLLVLDKQDLQPHTWCTDFEDPRFGDPETYMLTLTGSGGVVETPIIHASRLIMFGGVMTPRRRKVRRSSWDDSVLQRCWEILRDVDENWDSAVHILRNLSQTVYRVKDYSKMLAAGERERLQELMEYTDLNRSTKRAIMLDAEHESMEEVGKANVSAVPAILEKTWQRLAAAAGMPVTKLMGMSPAGLNATGESDLANWYAAVDTQRTRIALPALRKLYRYIAISEAFESVDLDEIDVKFPSLWQLTPKEEAEQRKSVAETDQIYIQSGVLLPHDVTLSRFGKGEWSAETTVDLELREELQAAEEEALREQMTREAEELHSEPPEAPAEDGE